MNPTPQPRIADDGTPLCQASCPHCLREVAKTIYYDFVKCELTQDVSAIDLPCGPAVAAMAAENERLSQEAVRVIIQRPDGTETHLTDEQLDEVREARTWADEMERMEAENDALREACKPLVWSKESPDKPGWWLRRDEGDAGDVTISVVRVSIDESGKFWTQRMNETFRTRTNWRYEWAGPIPQPTEPSE